MGQRSEGSRWSPAQALLWSVWEPSRSGGDKGPSPQAVPSLATLPPRHKITGLPEAGREPRATTSWSWPDLAGTMSPQARPTQPPGASQSTTHALDRAGLCPPHQLLPATQAQSPWASRILSVSMLSSLRRVALSTPEAPGLTRKDL